MDKIIYLSFYGFTFLIWLLPRFMRYLLSDFIFFLSYYLFRYRKNVVLENLNLCFPEKTIAEKNRICKQFFKNLVDVAIETLIQIHLTKKEIFEMYIVANPEILSPFLESKRSIIYAGAHFANWELNGSQCTWTKYPMLAAYKILTSQLVEKFMTDLRIHVGSIPVKMQNIFREVIRRTSADEVFAIGLLADQAPMPDESHFWTLFFGQETSFFMGPEKIARKYNLPIIFPKVKRVKRGFYVAEFVILCKEPKQVPEYEITNKYVSFLESVIREDPSNWLWSHRRWKRKREQKAQLI